MVPATLSLKTRILFLAALLVVGASLASWLAFQALTEEIVERWGRQVAEIQVRYDSARLLQSLEREIALSRQMADSVTLVNWAKNPADEKLRAEAIRQMESFRDNFRDKSYFVALRKNLHYYYNNAANEFAGKQFRYVLDPGKAEDAWFFQLIEEGRDFHLNVNPDVELGVTKLWIDVLMRDDAGQIVGMVGTGLDLDAFLQNIVDIGQDGITTLFVDYNGAIQLYRDRNYIDFASIIKPEGQKNTIDLLFELPEDKRQVLSMLSILKKDGGEVGAVESRFVTVEVRKQLAGDALVESVVTADILGKYQQGAVAVIEGGGVGGPGLGKDPLMGEEILLQFEEKAGAETRTIPGIEGRPLLRGGIPATFDRHDIDDASVQGTDFPHLRASVDEPLSVAPANSQFLVHPRHSQGVVFYDTVHGDFQGGFHGDLFPAGFESRIPIGDDFHLFNLHGGGSSKLLNSPKLALFEKG